jgi:hydrogenase nickel incorporation protein HypB
MTRIADLRQKLRKTNDLLAADLRARFSLANVTVVHLVSSPGAGKTSLLESTLRALQPRYRVAVLAGSVATDHDAQRLGRAAAHVHAITTDTVGHLDAGMIDAALSGWSLAPLDFLFIENVGNLVCPATYDVGETIRVVLLSVPEGEDEPLKYPAIFNSADLAVITKIDLADAVGFRRKEARANIRAVAPGLATCEVSVRSGEGLADWLRYVQAVGGGVLESTSAMS